ncbi:efflux RND transporter periplasmic adaptor subunit [Candidatus Gracilibacteria bacterium]|nr:efflux RND transporter periplasmic adaptor subunit [Candidatus Gracilibacteria bacterium]NJM88646.1 efflux RND transporter periplasmic adaptor subunit [Hydrococcus sp. RU_2_2]NJP18806.1 efflux RND transporter periplasmic adaptor subunit [Hydrococcus sp. CRU_1_1]
MNPVETQDPRPARQSDESEQLQTEPSQPKKPWLWILLILALTTGGIVLWRILTPVAQTAQPAATQPQGPPPRPVNTVALSRGTGTRRVQLLGQVESREQATIRAQTDGLVQQILVQPGDRVTPGMTIAQLDDSDQQLALAEAQARLAQERSNLARLEVGTRPEILAQRRASVKSAAAREREAQDNLDRLTNLVAEGAFSQRNLVEARAALDDSRGERLEAEAALAEAVAGPIKEEIAAQRANVAAAVAAVNQAEVELRRTRVRALSGGIVQERQVSAGDYLESADAIATLVASDSLDVFLEIPEELSGNIRPGLSVQLTTRALPQWRERATITGVVPAADSASRRQRVRVRLNNPPSGLLSGMAVTGALEMPSNRSSFVVSRDALTRRQNQWLVFTVVDDKAQELEVEMVADMGQEVAIASEQLRAGQPIVLQGGDGLSDGANVKVTNGGVQ